MGEFQAIYGVFLNPAQELLLLRRTQRRTYRPGELDLMGGEIQLGENPERAFLREAQVKLGAKVVDYHSLAEPVVAVEDNGDIGVRHIFICHDLVESAAIDRKKYDGLDWFSREQLRELSLVESVKRALRLTGLLRDGLPPVEWFHAIGNRGRGFTIIQYSELLLSLHPQLNNQLGQWSHLRKRNVDCDIDEAKAPRFSDEFCAAAEFVRKITGYEPRALLDTKTSLLDEIYEKFQVPDHLQGLKNTLVD